MWKKIIIKFYFYCTKIRALLRTSLMFLWELKNAIISQNLRELCDIKANTKNPHTVASWTSFADFQSVLSHQLFHYTVPEPVEGRSYSSLWFRELRSQTFSLCSITVLFITTLGAWACRRPFLFLPVISTPLNHRIIYYYTRCLSLSKAHSHF